MLSACPCGPSSAPWVTGSSTIMLLRERTSRAMLAARLTMSTSRAVAARTDRYRTILTGMQDHDACDHRDPSHESKAAIAHAQTQDRPARYLAAHLLERLTLLSELLARPLSLHHRRLPPPAACRRRSASGPRQARGGGLALRRDLEEGSVNHLAEREDQRRLGVEASPCERYAPLGIDRPVFLAPPAHPPIEDARSLERLGEVRDRQVSGIAHRAAIFEGERRHVRRPD